MISFHHYNSHQHFAWMNALLTPPFPSLTLSFPQSMDECLSRQLTFTEGFLPVPTSSTQTLCSKPSSTLPFKRRKHLLANMVVQTSHSSWPSWVMGFVSFIFQRDRTMCWNHIQLWQGEKRLSLCTLDGMNGEMTWGRFFAHVKMTVAGHIPWKG